MKIKLVFLTIITSLLLVGCTKISTTDYKVEELETITVTHLEETKSVSIEDFESTLNKLNELKFSSKKEYYDVKGTYFITLTYKRIGKEEGEEGTIIYTEYIINELDTTIYEYKDIDDKLFIAKYYWVYEDGFTDFIKSVLN